MTKPQNRPEQVARTNRGQFRKGQSGNPGGRPKTVGHVRDLAQAHTEDAIRALVGVIKSTKAPPAARVSAATALLDRGWGRPAQPIGGAEDLPPIKHRHQLSDEYLAAIAAGDNSNG